MTFMTNLGLKGDRKLKTLYEGGPRPKPAESLTIQHFLEFRNAAKGMTARLAGILDTTDQLKITATLLFNFSGGDERINKSSVQYQDTVALDRARNAASNSPSALKMLLQTPYPVSQSEIMFHRLTLLFCRVHWHSLCLHPLQILDCKYTDISPKYAS